MYLFVLHSLARKCTKIYNACRTIVRLIKPFVLPRFHYRCGLLRSLLLRSIKSHDVDVSVFCLLLYLRFKPRSHWKIPSEQNCAACHFPHWKSLYHSPMEISGNSHRNVWSNWKRPMSQTISVILVCLGANKDHQHIMLCDAIVFWLPTLCKWLPQKKAPIIPSLLLWGFSIFYYIIYDTRIRILNSFQWIPIETTLVLFDVYTIFYWTLSSISITQHLPYFNMYRSVRTSLMSGGQTSCAF